MERGKNPGDEDDRQESKPLQSKEQPKTMPKIMIKIPVEHLTERQKRLLCQNPQPKGEPSTSSKEKEDVFKVPMVPPLRKKGASPSKDSSDVVSIFSSTDVVHTVQDASSQESVAPEKTMDAAEDEEV